MNYDEVIVTKVQFNSSDKSWNNTSFRLNFDTDYSVRPFRYLLKQVLLF